MIATPNSCYAPTAPWRVSLLAMLLVVTWMGAPARAQSGSARDITERMVNEVVARELGTTRAEWRRRNPGAEWREFAGKTGHSDEPTEYRWPEGAWCAIADDDQNGLHRQAVFRGVHAALQDCSLTQLTITFEPSRTDPAAIELAELYGELIVALTRQYGFGYPQRQNEALVKAEVERRAYGSPWEGLFSWTSNTFSVSLFMVPTARVGIVVLDDLFADASRIPDALPDPYALETVLRGQLLKQLRQTYPDAVELILDRDGLVDEPEAIALAARLLNAMNQSTTDDERAWRALAAEELILRLEPSLGGNEEPMAREVMRPLVPFELEFEYDGHDDHWIYRRGLSEAVMRRYPQSPWAQLALVRKIVGGWTLTECRDTYRDVAIRGEQWLGDNPSSPYRLVVTQAVAQAYETWWSLSKAPEYDELAFSSKKEATDGAAAARVKALEWNERLLNVLPAGLPHQDVERTLAQLHADIDTAERRFHCAVP